MLENLSVNVDIRILKALKLLVAENYDLTALVFSVTTALGSSVVNFLQGGIEFNC